MHAARAARLFFLIQPLETIVFWRPRCHFLKGRGKPGHIVAHDVSWARKRAGNKINVVFHVAQTGKHLWRTQNVSEQNQKHFLCPGHKICARNKCCARGQTGKHLCPQQCVLVCQGFKLTFITFVSCRRHQHMKLTFKLCL